MTSNSLIVGLITALALATGPAWSAPQPLGKSNGTLSGTLAGHALELPVLCEGSFSNYLAAVTHSGTVHNARTTEGVEPAISIMGVSGGFQFVGFVGGKRYKFIRTKTPIDTSPFKFSRKMRSKKLGDYEVDFTLDCPTIK